jgi:hypothetical protein
MAEGEEEVAEGEEETGEDVAEGEEVCEDVAEGEEEVAEGEEADVAESEDVIESVHTVVKTETSSKDLDHLTSDFTSNLNNYFQTLTCDFSSKISILETKLSNKSDEFVKMTEDRNKLKDELSKMTEDRDKVKEECEKFRAKFEGFKNFFMT